MIPADHVRMMAPDGAIGTIPDDQVEAAVAAGGKVMGPDQMRELRAAVFHEHLLHKDGRQKQQSKARSRNKSLRLQMRAKR